MLFRSEAINAAVAQLQAAQEHLSRDDVAELRRVLDPAIAEADAGTFVDFSAEAVIASSQRRRLQN